MTQDPNSLPSRLSDDALAKIISEERTTVRDIPTSSRDVADRLAQFNELYDALTTKPDDAALIYTDPLTGSAKWSAIGNRLLVGRFPKSASNAVSTLEIQDKEMSRQHFEIVLTSDGLYLLNDLNSLNGTYVDRARQEIAVLIGGSEIRAGNTTFIFTGR
ncbi:MAG TPA: FHA domain-containing protein [Candidatus Udaeobacter sp.]|nr:FHA domain-containing protein [Candidatus Udaeobacter sp.]